jgi:8-oxo-dGTP pyrophosphatase MutT (NUDIX family)
VTVHAAVPLDRDWLAWRLAGAASREALVPGDVRVPAPGAGQSSQPAGPGHAPGNEVAFEKARIPAAVLVPLIPRPEGVAVLLTERAGHLSRHAGQVAFPGGRCDPDDDSIVHTALREAQEEVGLDPARVDVLGVLPQYRTRTGFLITPVVGWIEPPFSLLPDPGEVADVFEMPLAFVLDPANHERHHRDADDGRRYFYVLPFQDRYIWGATAAMLVNFHHVLTSG